MAAKSGGVPGIALVAILGGAVLAYSGVKGKGISASVRALISGQNPSDLPTTQGIAAPSGTLADGTSGTVTYSPGEQSGNFGGSSGGVLSGTQVAQIAYNAGFRGQALVNMVAIAKRESGWNPNAHNTNAGTGDNSYGLWQINMLGSLGPSRLLQFGISSYDQLFNPVINAKAAWILSGHGSNFTPWSTWRGLSQADLNSAAQAVQAAGLG